MSVTATLPEHDFFAEEPDGEVHSWDLKAHRLQNFHAYGDDPTPVLEQIAEWSKTIHPTDLVRISLERGYSDTEDREFVEAAVEYVGTRPPTVREVQWDCWRVSEDHGWHEDLGPHTFVEKLALIHSEISEALEEHRNGHAVDEIYSVDGKPEGVPIELADAMIRIFDLAEICSIDIGKAIDAKQAYNRTRPYRHGGKTC